MVSTVKETKATTTTTKRNKNIRKLGVTMIEQSVSSGASGEELTATNAAFANNTMFGFRVSSSVSRLNLMTEESPQFIDSLKCSHEECQETFVRLVDLHNHMFFVHNKVKQE